MRDEQFDHYWEKDKYQILTEVFFSSDTVRELVKKIYCQGWNDGKKTNRGLLNVEMEKRSCSDPRTI